MNISLYIIQVGTNFKSVPVPASKLVSTSKSVQTLRSVQALMLVPALKAIQSFLAVTVGTSLEACEALKPVPV